MGSVLCISFILSMKWTNKINNSLKEAVRDLKNLNSQIILENLDNPVFMEKL